MHNKALISLGQFCNNNYTVELIENTTTINHVHDPMMYLFGCRDRTTGMWILYLSYPALLPKGNSNPLQDNNVYGLNQNVILSHTYTKPPSVPLHPPG